MSQDDSVRRTLNHLEEILRERASSRARKGGDAEVEAPSDRTAGGTGAATRSPAGAEVDGTAAADSAPSDRAPAAETSAGAAVEGRRGSRRSLPHPSRTAKGNGRPYRRLTARLGTLLLDEGLISVWDLEKALQAHRDSGERLGHYLVDQGLVSEDDLVRVLSNQYGIPAARLDELEIGDPVLDLIPVEMARRHLILPIEVQEGALNVAMVDPTDVVALANIKFATGLRPQPLIATEKAVLKTIRRLYGPLSGSKADEARLELGAIGTSELHRSLRKMVLDRDEAMLNLGEDVRTAFHLAASVDIFVEDIIRAVRETDD